MAERNWRYIIVKSSRWLSNAPFQGKTCERAGIQGGKIYDDYREADRDAKELSKHNPVGFFVKLYKEPKCDNPLTPH